MQAATAASTKTFSAFQHRNYRLWFIGQLTSIVGSWMQITAQGYLIYSLTGSQAYLGLVGFVSGVPALLFMLFGGLVADRMPRRTLMIIIQSFMMLLAFILAGLVFFDLVQPWHILVFSFLLGVANAFDTPARLSLVADLVPKEDMTNAIAFNAIMFHAGLIIGPAIGGLIYAYTGPALCFIINGLSFIAVIVALALMQIPALVLSTKRPSALKAIAEGLRYMRNDRLSLTLSFSTLVVSIFGFGLLVLLPAWAVEVLGGDVKTVGLLTSVRGVGAVIGGLAIASLASRGLRGKMWAAGSFIIPIAIAGFAFSERVPISAVFLALMGFGTIIMLNNSNAMVQSRVPDALRGRAMSLYSLMFMAGAPMGSLLVGSLAEFTSAQATALVCAAGLLIFAVVIWFLRPDVRLMK